MAAAQTRFAGTAIRRETLGEVSSRAARVSVIAKARSTKRDRLLENPDDVVAKPSRLAFAYAI